MTDSNDREGRRTTRPQHARGANQLGREIEPDPARSQRIELKALDLEELEAALADTQPVRRDAVMKDIADEPVTLPWGTHAVQRRFDEVVTDPGDELEPVITAEMPVSDEPVTEPAVLAVTRIERRPVVRRVTTP